MSNVARIAAQAANTLTKPLNVEDVFSTYLYTGDATTSKQITNNIDLSTEGGLVWIKRRSDSSDHRLMDTERGASSYLASNTTDAASTGALSSFNTDGFTIGNASAPINANNSTYASWTFRKAPKFFDVVTYTGDGTSSRAIPHNLGVVPGFIIVKRRDSTNTWTCYHRDRGKGKWLDLAGTAAEYSSTTAWANTTPTSTNFYVGSFGATNQNTGTYVAYLFAHNDGDGDFGPDANADIIKCGSYTGNGSTDGPEIDLGFEPQFVIVKNATAVSDWRIFDTMRGWHVASGSNDQLLSANLTSAESGGGFSAPNATGFKIDSTGSNYNTSGQNYIYIAIRRGTAVPESATDVFDVGDASETGSTAPEYEGGFTVDFAIKRIMSASQPNYVFDRLRGGQSLITNGTSAESAFGAAKFDYMDGYYNGTSTSSANWSAMWKRAPNYFDVVAYTGNGPSVNTVNHNLGVKPEMIWIKGRDTTFNWVVYHDMTASGFKRQYLNLSNGDNTVRSYNSDYGLYSEPTDTQIQIDDIDADLYNGSGQKYIAYLFASLDGVSKVGSYTGSASAQTIDCGFTAGARFVLIKRTDSTGSWVVWDTNRGIVAGNDPYFKLETNAAPTTTDDIIDPHNSGFTLAGGVGFINTSGGSYIFYAIA